MNDVELDPRFGRLGGRAYVSETETDRSRISRTRQTHAERLLASVFRPGLIIIRTAVPQCFSSGGRGSQHVLVGFASL